MRYIKYIGYVAAGIALSYIFLLIVGIIAGVVAKGFSLGYNLW